MALRAPPPAMQQAIGPLLSDFVSRVVSAWMMARQPPVQVTSWYRTPEENRRVGGHPRSLHQLGLALDLVLPVSPHGQVVAAMQRSGIIAVDEGTHVHVQLFPASTLDL